MEKTEWFPPEIKPVYVGLYEQIYKGSTVTDLYWWDGKQWCFTNQRSWACASQDREWRGLTDPCWAENAL